MTVEELMQEQEEEMDEKVSKPTVKAYKMCIGDLHEVGASLSMFI